MPSRPGGRFVRETRRVVENDCGREPPLCGMVGRATRRRRARRLEHDRAKRSLRAADAARFGCERQSRKSHLAAAARLDRRTGPLRPVEPRHQRATPVARRGRRFRQRQSVRHPVENARAARPAVVVSGADDRNRPSEDRQGTSRRGVRPGALAQRAMRVFPHGVGRRPGSPTRSGGRGIAAGGRR